MSYWLELHCDANIADNCSGLNHSGPMTSCATVEHGRSIVNAEAKTRGWKRIGGDLHCAACVKHKEAELA
jgi:hypothetical protein